MKILKFISICISISVFAIFGTIAGVYVARSFALHLDAFTYLIIVSLVVGFYAAAMAI